MEFWQWGLIIVGTLLISVLIAAVINSRKETSEIVDIKSQNTFSASVFILIIWGIVFLGMVIFVPFSHFIISEGETVKVVEVIEYNWFFNTYEIERGFASLINYKLLIFKMLTWSIVCLAAYAVMHQSKK
jgi:hypothetical protein